MTGVAVHAGEASTLWRIVQQTPAGRADRAPYFARLHDLGPLLPLDDGSWLAVGYDTARQLLGRRDVGTDWDELMDAAGIAGRWRSHPSLRLVSRLLISANGAEHARLRYHATECMRPLLDGLSGRLDRHARGLADRLGAAGHGDLVTAFAVPLGLRTLAEIVGPTVEPTEVAAAVRAFNAVLEPSDIEQRLSAADEAAQRLAALARATEADLVYESHRAAFHHEPVELRLPRPSPGSARPCVPSAHTSATWPPPRPASPATPRTPARRQRPSSP